MRLRPHAEPLLRVRPIPGERPFAVLGSGQRPIAMLGSGQRPVRLEP
jgi:hypothetical protein